MEPRQPKPQKPKGNSEPPQVEGGEKDQTTEPQPAPEPRGGMIGEGGGASGDREGGMIDQG